MSSPGRVAIAYVAAGVLLLLTPFIGIQDLDWRAVFAGDSGDPEAQIFWQIRLPRIVLAFLCGSALSVSGLAFQAVFRNPLATPFTLGVSMGASFGAALYVTLGISFSFFFLSGTSFFSLSGAVLAIGVVYGLTRIRAGFSTATLLLAGVAVSFCFSSTILFLQYIGDFSHSYRIARWLMGGLETIGYQSVLQVLPFVGIGVGCLAWLSRELDLMTAGEEIAASRGVNVDRTKRLVFFAASLMVGGVVAVCGPIGFVGMMVPHICRLSFGVAHRRLVPATVVLGGVFLSVCDGVARIIIAPAEMPVGIITAMIGGPFFLWLLLARSGSATSHSI